MNIYYAFYCRAYDWYNPSKNKTADTLRVSAIALLSTVPVLNLLTIIFVFSIVQRHTLVDKWVAAFGVAASLIFNFILISSRKSDLLRKEYLQFDQSKRKAINAYFYFYLIGSAILMVLTVCYTAYYKHKYGNYDL
jgi:hypothetical protein